MDFYIFVLFLYDSINCLRTNRFSASDPQNSFFLLQDRYLSRLLWHSSCLKIQKNYILSPTTIGQETSELSFMENFWNFFRNKFGRIVNFIFSLKLLVAYNWRQEYFIKSERDQRQNCDKPTSVGCWHATLYWNYEILKHFHTLWKHTSQT